MAQTNFPCTMLPGSEPMLLVLTGVAHNPLETSLRKSMSMLSFLGFLPPKTTTRNSYERSRRRNCSGSRVPQVNGYFTSHHQLVPHINQRTFEFLVFSDTHPSSYMLYCHRRFKPPHNFDSRLVFHRFISGYRPAENMCGSVQKLATITPSRRAR